MKRTVFDYVGLFDEEMLLSRGTDWFFRAGEKGVPISVSKNLVLLYRKHQNNRINNRKMFKALKKAKDRKKASEQYVLFNPKKPSGMDELIEMWDTVEI